MKVYVVYDLLYEEVVKVFKAESEADKYADRENIENERVGGYDFEVGEFTLE